MTMTSTPRWLGLAGMIVAVAVGSVIAHLCTSALPLLIGALMNGYGFTATAAGLTGFFQIGALAVSMIVIAPLTHRFRPLSVAYFGMALAAAGNLLMYWSPAYLPLICVLATLVGTGYGLVLTAAVAAAAGSARPDLTYAAGNSGAVLLIVPIMSLLPLATVRFGTRATFFAIPLLILIAVPFMLGLRSQRSVKLAEQVTVHSFATGLPLLVIWSLFSFGTGAMWAFTERIGASLSLSGPTIGLILSSSAFTGLIGTSLAAYCSDKVDRTIALGVGVVGGGASCLLFAVATNVWIFAAAAVAYWIFTMFVYILLLGTAAMLDPTGRLGTLGTGCERLAFAIGAPFGGLMVDFGSYFWLSVSTAFACAVIAPAFLPGLKRMLRTAATHRVNLGDNGQCDALR